MHILRTTAIAAAATAFGTAASAQVEIEYWQYFFDARVEAMEALIEGFEAANPDITVTMTTFPYADYRTKVAAAIPAGEGPDVVQLFYGWLGDYIEAELIQPLPEDTFPAATIDEAFFPMVQAMKVDGQYWALPTAVRSLALFYNERLMEAAGIDAPPETLEEMVEAARAMTERDGAGNITQVGLTAGMNAQDHHWFSEVLVRQHGGTPYTDEMATQVAYDSDAGRQALEFYTSLTEGEDAVSSIGFMDEPQAAFKAGRAGMHIDGSFRIGVAGGDPRASTGAWPSCPPGRTARGPTTAATGSTRSPPRPRASATTPPSSSWTTSPPTRRCRSGWTRWASCPPSRRSA